MRWYLIPIYAYIFAVLQSSLLFPSDWARPDFLVVLALFIAIVAQPVEAFVVIWAIGMIEDLLLGGGPLGISAMLFVLVLMPVVVVRQYAVMERILVQLIVVVMAMVLIRVPQMLLLGLISGEGLPFFDVLRRTFGDTVFTAIFAPYLLWLLMKTVNRRAGTLQHR